MNCTVYGRSWHLSSDKITEVATSNLAQQIMIRHWAWLKTVINCAKNSKNLSFLPIWRLGGLDRLAGEVQPLSPQGFCHEVPPTHKLILNPFCQAVANLPALLSASTVHKECTPYSSTSNPLLLPNLQTGRSPGKNLILVSVLPPQQLVFSSPVKSGFFPQNEATGNCNRSRPISIFRDRNRTLKDRS